MFLLKIVSYVFYNKDAQGLKGNTDIVIHLLRVKLSSKIEVIIIVIVNLYSASSGDAPQRHSRPNKTKP